MAARQVVPRGIEVLLRKAAVDPEFREVLIRERAGAADGILLALTDAERAVLSGIPEGQLRGMIGRTEVPEEQRPVFRYGAAAAMLAAVAGLALMVGCPVATGSRPQEPPVAEDVLSPEDEPAGGSGGTPPEANQTSGPDEGVYHGPVRGIRADDPEKLPEEPR